MKSDCLTIIKQLGEFINSTQINNDRSELETIVSTVMGYMQVGLNTGTDLSLKNFAWKFVRDVTVKYSNHLIGILDVNAVIDTLCNQIESCYNETFKHAPKSVIIEVELFYNLDRVIVISI